MTPARVVVKSFTSQLCLNVSIGISCIAMIDVRFISLFWFCSPSEKWLATCWWRSTSLTTCRWRTWGSSEASRCTRVAILWPSSSTTDGMATTAWGSWACATSQVWTPTRVRSFFILCVMNLKTQKNPTTVRRFVFLLSSSLNNVLLKAPNSCRCCSLQNLFAFLHRRQVLFVFAEFGSPLLRERKSSEWRRSSSWEAAVTSNLSGSGGAHAQGHFSFFKQDFHGLVFALLDVHW